MHIKNGKEFETLILNRTKVDERENRYTLNRYGVMSSFQRGSWRPIPSLPDFEGVLPDGRQFIFDAKVCALASYPLSGGTSKSFKNQYRHMQRRAKFNVLCFLLIHFNPRELKTRSEPHLTVLFPIKRSQFWDDYEAAMSKRISRTDAKFMGVVVEWNKVTKRTKTLTPDILKAINNYRSIQC